MVVKMKQIYFVIIICAIIFGAYFYGVNIERAKCKIKFLQQQNQTQEQIVIKQRNIHETVYKTGVGDIRIILRDKYTIAD